MAMQIALFVDAGYLYAQGSSLLVGQKQERMVINLTGEASQVGLAKGVTRQPALYPSKAREGQNSSP